jgi:hypothetical protein
VLKLRAYDQEDLQVVAAHLQDAIVPVSEMLFLPHAQRFILVANRFRWSEASAMALAQPPGDASFAEGRPSHYERIHCGLRFDRVRAVRSRGFDRRARGEMLNLLTVVAGAGTIDLVFAGGADLRLEVATIDCRLEDIGEAWPTRWHPRHAAAEEVEG